MTEPFDEGRLLDGVPRARLFPGKPTGGALWTESPEI